MIVAGTDEAGRGPLAGPVVAAAVILTRPQARVLIAEGLQDSKKLKESSRERLFHRMGELGICWRAQAASHERIDRMNILRASLWAMRQAVAALPIQPDLLIVDGTVRIDGMDITQKTLPKADDLVPCVAAASIIAKVLRDRVMVQMDRLFPSYGFSKHKGYPTKQHKEALLMMGPSPIHRRSFQVKGIDS